MADPSPVPENEAPKERRFRAFEGLSARLLTLTVLIVALGNLLVLPPSLAAAEEGWLLDRLRAAELATLVEETAPGGHVTEVVRQKLLNSAGVVSVALQVGGERRLILQAPQLARTPYLVDLRHPDAGLWLAPYRTLFGRGDAMVRVMAKPRFREAVFVEIVAPDGPLRKALSDQLLRLLGGAVFTSVLAGGMVYLSLNFLLAEPIRRLTVAMERFRADPTDPQARISLSRRRDEIGRAEVELDRMQVDLLGALASRARLAALGEAVAKINHDLRNMLASAQMASDRLAAIGDPKVAAAMPRLERALDRAIDLASNVLAFGRSEEPAPTPRLIALAAAVEAAAEDAGLHGQGVVLVSHAPAEAQVWADPDHLHRILVNLLRNAREAIEAMPDRGGIGRIEAQWAPSDGSSRLYLRDDGPGLPERAREKLFQPFLASTRRGGAGLGLAIARELARAQGGDLVLVASGPDGATFELTLPTAHA